MEPISVGEEEEAEEVSEVVAINAEKGYDKCGEIIFEFEKGNINFKILNSNFFT